MCFSLNILSQFQKRTTLPNATSSLSCRCHRQSTWTQQSTALQHQQLTFSKEPTRISQTPSIHLSTLNAPALESRSRFLKSCHVWFPSPIILEAALDSGAFVTQHRFERTSLHCDGTMRKIQKTSPKIQKEQAFWQKKCSWSLRLRARRFGAIWTQKVPNLKVLHTMGVNSVAWRPAREHWSCWQHDKLSEQQTQP